MKSDGRCLDHQTLEAFRLRAIECLQNGESPEVVSRILGVHISTVYKWKRLSESGGWEKLQAVAVPGRPRALDTKAEEWLKATLKMIKFEKAFRLKAFSNLIIFRVALTLDSGMRP